VLDHGALARDTYAALHRLAEGGMILVAVTGRPSSWGAVIARQWPVHGVVAENGAIAHSKQDGRVQLWDELPPDARASRQRRLREIADAVLAAFPGLRLADDCSGRTTDVTIDIGEFERVAADVVSAAIELATRLGARTSTSSVHLHLSLDGDDKATGVVRFLGRRFGQDPTACRWKFAFIGDSENDASCFAAFRTTIAVRNFRGRPTVMPRFLVSEERGKGFVRAADLLLSRGKRA
jgi:hydroxymethylpyrimidine pyrophosphatase-like HAD family hydrolase